MRPGTFGIFVLALLLTLAAAVEVSRKRAHLKNGESGEAQEQRRWMEISIFPVLQPRVHGEHACRYAGSAFSNDLIRG